MSELLAKFAPLLASVSEAEIHGDPTLNGRLVIERSGDVVVSYAPFEHIQLTARVVIVGITPGREQAREALKALRKALLDGKTPSDALAAAKVFASFSGSLRPNLVAMLDYVGLSRWLGIASTASLWGRDEHLVHFTSALRYPVFVSGKNYSGQPSMVATPALRRVLDQCLQEEVLALKDAVWLPLGPTVTQGLEYLIRSGVLAPDRVLAGLPHPSGANAERIAYFLGRKAREALSAKTNPATIDAARARIMEQVARLTLSA